MSRVELKSYKEVKSMSEETVCFQAAVYVDGKKVGDVSNDGRGGPHRWQPWSAEKVVGEIAKAIPRYAEFSQEQADCLVNDLGFAITLGKDVAKDIKTCLAFEKNDGTYGRTGKVNEAMQNAARTNQEWSSKNLAKLNAKRWIFTADEGVALIVAEIESKRKS